MDIPFDIKIFNWIYESGKYLLPLLFVLWLTWLFCVVILRKRKQFLLTSAAFLMFCLLNAAFTWSGWHYRMELRERYAAIRLPATGGQKGYDIGRMPADIRREYAKDGYGPRRRAVAAQVVWLILLIPLTLAGQGMLYLAFFRRKKGENAPEPPTPPEGWEKRLARAGFFIGAVIGILNFLLTGAGNIRQLWCCLPLALALRFGTWKNWRIPAIVLTLLFVWGGVSSCIRDVKLARNVRMVRRMYHDRAGFDFEKVFPPLPENVAVAEEGTGGMRVRSLYAADKPCRQFLTDLPGKGFKPLPKKTVVLRWDGGERTQKRIVSGNAFYKDLGKGFGAVAEYTGEYWALYIIRGLGE